MLKKLVKSGTVGFFIGIALSELIALVVSASLHLGYFMPCFAALPEQVGGELNAVAFQMAICGLMGMGVSIAWRIIRQHQWKIGKRIASAACSFIVSIIPAAVIAAHLLG